MARIITSVLAAALLVLGALTINQRAQIAEVKRDLAATEVELHTLVARATALALDAADR